MSLSEDWFTEIYEPAECAFSLRAEKLHEEDTPYQHIAIYQSKRYGRVMVIDNCFMLTSLDNFIYHEMMTHPALCLHPDPEQVLIIGGGDCGSLREVLRHDAVKGAVQVDIDERVTRLAEIHFPELCESNADPRAQLLFADGIDYVRRANDESLDIIIVDSTDPVGPAEGLFREPFYRDCLRALKPHGLLVQQSESPLLHAESIITPMHRTMRAAGFSDTASLQFPLSSYPSGWWTATMASKDARIDISANRTVSGTRYFNDGIFRSCFSLPTFLSKTLAEQS